MLRVSVIGASALALALALAGCSTLPQPKEDGALQREAMGGTERPVPGPMTIGTTSPSAPPLANPDITTGTGEFVRTVGPPKSKPVVAGTGTVTLNFENQPVESVVKAILGDLLHENYSIVPGLQGNVSFSTSQPVRNEQVLPILETLLSWTNNALVRTGDHYVAMPAKEAVAGNLVPSIGASAPPGGLQARLFPLRFISATEMQKLIKPFARADATLLADPTRNVLVMAGTPRELANYQRTIATFDVDWLRGMSVAVFSLQHAEVKDLTPTLDKLFGEKGNTPMAGLLRFIPVERTNSLVVISPQPAYLEEVKTWIERVDRGGNEPQLYVYDVRNVQASDMAGYLSDIYGGGSSDRRGKVGTGLSSGTLGSDGDLGNRGGSGLGSITSGFGSSASSGSGLINTTSGDSGTFGSGSSSSSSGVAGSGFGDDDSSSSHRQRNGPITTAEGVRIASVDSNNQVMVRCRPSQWTEIEQAIKRLDALPLQVQIETRILEVSLTGNFQFGVQWYLEGLVGSLDGKVGQPGNKQQWALGDGSTTLNKGKDAFFYSFVNSDLSVALHAMETSGNTKTLSAPSLVVLNNQKAHIQIGDQIPITQTFVNAGANTNNTIGQVEYKNTGVILNVRPRVNSGGVVYLNINQVVSSPGTKDAHTGNFPIQQREVTTQVAVQSGQTVLLGGLIKQNEGATDTGIPGLNHLPVVGRLFGSTTRNRDRTELIVLITPRVISSSEEAKQVSDEYQQKFESLRPLQGQGKAEQRKRP